MDCGTSITVPENAPIFSTQIVVESLVPAPTPVTFTEMSFVLRSLKLAAGGQLAGVVKLAEEDQFDHAPVESFTATLK